MQSRLQPYFTACAHRIFQHLHQTEIFSVRQESVGEAPAMQIKRSRALVHGQEKGLRFYTTVFGFVKDEDIPMGPLRWLTVNSPEGAPGVELVLEPMSFPPAQS
jgi:hypothetical protein